MTRHAALAWALAGLALLPALAGCKESPPPFRECRQGIDAARAGRFQEAVAPLTACAASARIDAADRAEAYQSLAWAYHHLGQSARAVESQEAGLRLMSPASYGEYINYALYLRDVGRHEDRLQAVLFAQAIERGQNRTSMMTQYHLGWVYSDLGRHAEAVEAFSQGIPAQPDFPYAYWRRGLAYEALDRRDDARRDFERVAKLLGRGKAGQEAAELLPALREKLKTYGLDRQYRP